MDSGFVNALYLRGWSKWQLGKSAEAIEDFNKTIELRPFDPQPYFLRGYAKVSLALYEDAIADYDESLRLNPNQPNVFHRRGGALAAAARYAEAVADFDKALSWIRPWMLSTLFAEKPNTKGNNTRRLLPIMTSHSSCFPTGLCAYTGVG